VLLHLSGTLLTFPSSTQIFSAKDPRPDPSTYVPGSREEKAGEEVTMPANSVPRMKGEMTCRRFFGALGVEEVDAG